MSTLAAKKNSPASPVRDEDLTQVSGGRSKIHDASTGKYYEWYGTFKNSEKYLCPKCGGKLDSFWGYYFSCGPCDETWYYEDKLIPNYSSGYWHEITKAQYDSLGDPRPR